MKHKKPDSQYFVCRRRGRDAALTYYETRRRIVAGVDVSGMFPGDVILPDVVRQSGNVSALQLVFDTIYRRVFLVPGAVMTSWFSVVPSQLPYAKGCGYRWLAPLLGCKYIAYSVEINKIENPGLASRGVLGSMTTASFVEDYANFGVAGLVASGIVFSAILVSIARLFGTAWQANMALNAIPLILLLEIPLSTVILTGGWMTTLLLYLLIFGQLATTPNHARYS